jgi:nicotinate-nucleotide adenylyltransferase
VRLGLLGGTFNPPHLGHLVMAQEAFDQLGLDRVWLVPVALPPHKAPQGDPGAAWRARLCELAIAGDGRFEVSRIEVERGGTSYTVDTLRALHDLHPGHELTFIVGGDNAFGLPGWREPREVLRLARMGIAERQGVVREDLARHLEGLGAAERLAFFDMPRMDLSSSDVRRRVADGRPIRYLVPDGVADAIAAEGFYRHTTGRLTA